MDKKAVDRLLNAYRMNTARRDFLRAEIAQLEQGIMVEEMPEIHAIRAQSYDVRTAGGAQTSIVETLALSDGYASATADAWKDELKQMQREYAALEHDCRVVDLWLGALNDREKTVITEHIINGRSMREMAVFSHKYFPYPLSADTVRGIKRSAMKKIYEIAR